MIATPALVPIRLAPASIIICASCRVRIPPEALTPSLSPATPRMREISAATAPPDEKPVLDYRSYGSAERDLRGRGANKWLLLFFVGYATANCVIVNYAPNYAPIDLVFPVMGFFAVVAPLFCIGCALAVQFSFKPRPFHPLALIAFVLGLAGAAVWSVMSMFWFSLSLS